MRTKREEATLLSYKLLYNRAGNLVTERTSVDIKEIKKYFSLEEYATLQTVIREATKKLDDAKAQLELAKKKAEEIRAQGLGAAQLSAKTLLERAEEDITRLEETKQSTIRVEEEKVVTQICEQISRLALSKAMTNVKTRLAKDIRLQRRVLDLNIALLGQITK